MPHRNLVIILAMMVLSLVSAMKVSRHGRYLIFAMNQIETHGLEVVGENELFEGALEGMTGQLDEYSTYISPEAMKKFQEMIDREFGGVGIEIRLDRETKELTVASPLVGTPAYEAGIIAGDRILRIDGKSTQGLSLRDASERMRGEPGEPVNLSILHHGASDPVDVEIVRAVIRIDTVLGDTRNIDGTWDYFLEGEDGIGYLRINSFGEQTEREMRRAVDWLIDRGMKGLIIDVRNDPGGLLMAAIGVCDMFVDYGVIVTTRRRDGAIKKTYSATGEGTYSGFPVAVLVNQYSASASEIVAACLQDRAGACVVGERTFGKGTVQELIDLRGKRGMLKLTTSSYWRPSGKNIHRGRDVEEEEDWGVIPNQGYEVKFNEEEFAEQLRVRFLRDIGRLRDERDTPRGENGEILSPLGADSQLKKAVEHIRQAAGDSGNRLKK
jgi:carboxyl-terminal processing protease